MNPAILSPEGGGAPLPSPEAGRAPLPSPEAVRERDEYLRGGLAGVGCDSCGVLVRAGKRSAAQTSVQWSGRSCRRLADLAGTRPAALVPTCPDLRDSIERAVREGRLEVS
ncbi:hypothetical protein [Actinoplanes sp. DH11]|uniref:hypothetical protein n=1 Tax=Actinoplanes sp. DH11 TaxID=2857011 RepID=UPI001E2F7444|nr:hypothetical protein [Actinoplanes sp. DH11]